MWCGAHNAKYQAKVMAIHNIPYAELIQISIFCSSQWAYNSSNKILISVKNVEVAIVKFKLLFWHFPGETEEIPKIPQSYQSVPTLILKLGTLKNMKKNCYLLDTNIWSEFIQSTSPTQYRVSSLECDTCLFMWGYMLQCIPSLKLMLGISQCQSLLCSRISHLFRCIWSVWRHARWPWVQFFFYHSIFCNSICCSCNSKINM